MSCEGNGLWEVYKKIPTRVQFFDKRFDNRLTNDKQTNEYGFAFASRYVLVIPKKSRNSKITSSIADHNEWPNEHTIIRRFLFRARRCHTISPDRNYREVTNLSFALRKIYLKLREYYNFGRRILYVRGTSFQRKWLTTGNRLRTITSDQANIQ